MLTIMFIAISSVLVTDFSASLSIVNAQDLSNNATNSALVYSLDSAEKVKNDKMAFVKDSVVDSLSIYQDSADVLRTNLISEVEDYMKSVAPRTRMSASNIVDKCIKHGYDITLLLSQGQQETHFATAGSNNCFGLYNKKHYRHPDQSVEDYIELMQRKYLINRTTEQLLASNVHQEKNKRAVYCTNPNYGRTISKIRKNIIKSTEIMDIYEDLQNVREIIVGYKS